MTLPLDRDPIYRGRGFQSETIELCVRWYITYRLSYRDLAAMMAERGIAVSHTTIMRWVLRYVPVAFCDQKRSSEFRANFGRNLEHLRLKLDGSFARADATLVIIPGVAYSPSVGGECHGARDS